MNAPVRIWLSLAMLAFCGGATSAEPLTVSYFRVNMWSAAVGDTVSVQFATGVAQHVKVTPWPHEGVEWLCVRSGDVQENQHNVCPNRAGENSINIPVRHSGVTLIAVNEWPVTIAATSDELNAFLRQNVATTGVAKMSPDSPATLRVRRIVSAKTLVRAAAPGGRQVPSAIGTSKTGQPVEIRPVFDPTAIQVGSDLPLSIYVAGQKKSGVKVQATHVPTGGTTSYITGPGSAGHFRIKQSGAWRIEVHHAEPLVRDASADWVIYSGTLTFEVPKKGVKK